MTAKSAKADKRLPKGVTRCRGVGSDAEGWREGCEDCLRRVAKVDDALRTVYMKPPAIIAFWCESHLA